MSNHFNNNANKYFVRQLYSQEGVADKIYERVELTVEASNGGPVSCMAYQLRTETRDESLEEYGADKLLPSLRYKNVIIQGAKEHNLPAEYITYLQNIPDNGYNGVVDVNIPISLH